MYFAADPRNNVESVFLPAGTSGNFTVTVRATNIAGDGVPGNADTTDQDFALVIYNASSAPPTQPTIGVSPTSLSFTATAGGGNPANQTIDITNTGSGTLNWTASSNASWLTVSPASGTAPSTLTASVDIIRKRHSQIARGADFAAPPFALPALYLAETDTG